MALPENGLSRAYAEDTVGRVWLNDTAKCVVDERNQFLPVQRTGCWSNIFVVDDVLTQFVGFKLEFQPSAANAGRKINRGFDIDVYWKSLPRGADPSGPWDTVADGRARRRLRCDGVSCDANWIGATLRADVSRYFLMVTLSDGMPVGPSDFKFIYARRDFEALRLALKTLFALSAALALLHLALAARRAAAAGDAASGADLWIVGILSAVLLFDNPLYGLRFLDPAALSLDIVGAAALRALLLAFWAAYAARGSEIQSENGGKSLKLLRDTRIFAAVAAVAVALPLAMRLYRLDLLLNAPTTDFDAISVARVTVGAAAAAAMFLSAALVYYRAMPLPKGRDWRQSFMLGAHLLALLGALGSAFKDVVGGYERSGAAFAFEIAAPNVYALFVLWCRNGEAKVINAKGFAQLGDEARQRVTPAGVLPRRAVEERL